MTTIDGSMGLMELMATRALRTARRKRERASIPASSWSAFLRFSLHLAGFTCLTIAGFAFTMIAGLVVAGLSCFVMSTLVTGKSDNSRMR